MNDKSLFHYVFGLLTGLLFIPVIEDFLNVIATWMQALLIKPNKIVLQGNKELAELQENEEPVQTNCIGFQIPNREEEYDEEE